MGELLFLPGEFGISTCFVSSLNQLIRLLPAKQLAISLTVVGEEAAQKLLSAYAFGIRHFPGSNLEQAELYQVDLPRIVLVGAKLSEIDLWGSDLRDADLRYTDLRGANLIEAKLAGVNLSGSNLTDADLIGSDLTGAVLRKACLCNSDLSGADLVGADLTGTNLEGAILDDVRWQVNEPRAT